MSELCSYRDIKLVCQPRCNIWQAVESTVVTGRSQESQAMADRITDEVNGILCQEAGAPTLSKQAVLDLIDQGSSQGGSQAGSAYLPSPSPSLLTPPASCAIPLNELSASQ